MNAAELLDRLWMATLAVTAGLCLVGLMRRPWRRAFGAEQACRLWWLPLLAVIASQLPHAPQVVQSAPLWLSMHWHEAHAVDLPVASASRLPLGLLAAWSLVAVGVAGWEIARHVRFTRRIARGARREDGADGIAMLRTEAKDVGPALVGCWKPRIVLPADFEHRYDAEERALILAHERMHARRHDLPVRLVGVGLRTLFWFQPMVWWALRSLRQDQELACDAAMLRRHAVHPRRYADALLKTQLSPPWITPIGCAWHTHPVKERIVMLKQARTPHFVRRSVGVVVTGLLGAGLVGVVYANTAHGGVKAAAADAKSRPEYQLDIGIDTVVQDDHGRHARRADMALCMRPDQPVSVKTHGMTLDARLQAVSKDRVHIAFNVSSDTLDKPQSMQMEGMLGKPMSMQIKPDGKAHAKGLQRIELDVTPIRGCPARNTVSTKMRDKSVRDAAETIAATAGLILDNPQALSVREVSFHFKDMDPVKAMHLLAQVDGKRAVFDGKHVRFEAQ